jgi:hypothetical protein
MSSSFILNKLDSLGPDNFDKKNSTTNLGNDRFERGDRTTSKRISATGLEKFLNRDLKGSIILNENDKFMLPTTIDNNEDDEEREFIKQKIDLEIKNILDSRKNFMMNTLTMENFSFDFHLKNEIVLNNNNVNLNTITLSGASNKMVNMTSKTNLSTQTKSKVNFNTNVNKQNNIKLVENIDEILAKIQVRKEKVILQKKMMQTKLEKVGIKIC